MLQKECCNLFQNKSCLFGIIENEINIIKSYIYYDLVRLIYLNCINLCRVRMLSHMKGHQIEELKAFLIERFKLQSSAERLAEKYEEINDKQLEFTKR